MAHEIGPGGSRVFNAPFTITSYIISNAERPGGTYVESETKIFDVSRVTPQKLSMVAPTNPQQNAYLAIDQQLASPTPPPVGTIIQFTNGTNAQYPGWFVGTSINFQTGQISGPFSGSVQVTNADQTAALLATGVPATSTWGLVVIAVSLAAIGIVVAQRRLGS